MSDAALTAAQARAEAAQARAEAVEAQLAQLRDQLRAPTRSKITFKRLRA